jgi:type III restriction enzyme
MTTTDNNNISLEVAHRLTAMVNETWASGEMLHQVTPITAELLTYWFGDYRDLRHVNFHDGQRQAILNIIYLHEVVGVKTVFDTYEATVPELLPLTDRSVFTQEKYRIPKYAVKMATGTGKTWVMHALLIWQILNARHEDTPSGRFTKHFLIVAPGLIVYDRLKDAFCGRLKRGTDVRDIQTNDYYYNQELFLPPQYRQEVFSFIQNNVVTKEDGIGRKTTGEGLIALTNWHLFESQLDDETDIGAVVPDAQYKKLVSDLLPIRPGVAAGNALSTLDNRALRGNEIDYLASLTDLMVINDEAHHIHELKRNGQVEEMEWQRGLNAIAAGKGSRFMQVDFSATPYDTVGSGKRLAKRYFPHIIVDFDLATAIRKGLVKTLLIDRRQQLTDLADLDFRAIRDDRNKVTGLSVGQRLMLRAGLTKLRKLEKDFLEVDKRKNPKMLVMCEDTNVSPFVIDFLKDEGLSDEDVVKIDSSTKGEVKEDDWKRIKTQLFDIDNYPQPKVIVSVLMLREGFDVNNICVIVPLRSTQAPILLEQTIGRGLRLMWREPEYQDQKLIDRKRVLVLKKNPETYIDMLSIIEHPAFLQFYDELFADGLASVDSNDVESMSTVGDLISVGLKENYADYDLQWPVIIHRADEELQPLDIDINKMAPFTSFTLAQLRRALASDGEQFISQEATSRVVFGSYKVTADLFTANNYNEYLQKMLHIVMRRYGQDHRKKVMPNFQIDESVVVGAMDSYIRTRLFGEPFNPFHENDWKILLAKNGVVTEHIVKQLARMIYQWQENMLQTDADVDHTTFSSVKTLRMRESCSLPLQKTIYERLPFPSHGGGLERAFMEFLDRDATVERFIKINETQHSFAAIFYLRSDGMMATYHPDFLVATAQKIYLIETKGQDKIDDKDVRAKQLATLNWVREINALPPADRMSRSWEYVLLGETTFYALSGNGATITDICERCKVSRAAATGNLFE